MAVRILFLSSEVNWSRAERLPLACREAGLSVGIVYPAGSVLALVAADWHAVWRPETWVRDGQFDAAAYQKQLLWCISQSQPDLLVPLDDGVVACIAGSTPWECAEGAKYRLLFERSLGVLEMVDRRTERRALIDLAESAGVRIAPTLCATAGSLTKFGERHGYQCCIKRERTAGGEGIVRVSSRGEFEQACLAEIEAGRPFVAQRFIEGTRLMRMFVAQHGRVVAGLTAEKRHCYPEPFGTSSVIVPCEEQAASAACESIARYWGLSGCASADFIRENNSGDVYLIEFNPRAVTLMHLGACIGIDVPKALAALATGESVPLQGEDYSHATPIAIFPKEWYRDPASPYLASGLLHDIPWRYPQLVQHYVRLFPNAGPRKLV